MRRREVMSGLGVCALSAVSGCSILTGSNINTATKIPEVKNWEFQIVKVETNKPVEQLPQITCTPSESRVQITGVMYQGRRCDTIAPKTMSLEDGEYRLVIAAFNRNESCGDLLVKAEYKVNLEFTEHVPDVVTVVEASDRHGEQKDSIDCYK